MKNSIPALLLIMVASITSGCATLTRGTTDTFLVESEPSGADVRLSTGETCTTPCKLEKNRKECFTVHVEKNGFEPVEVEIASESCKAGMIATAGNLLMIGGSIGAIMDRVSGATKDLTPNPCIVTLEPAEDRYAEAESRQCPVCSQVVGIGDKVCRHCGGEIPGGPDEAHEKL